MSSICQNNATAGTNVKFTRKNVIKKRAAPAANAQCDRRKRAM